MSLAGKRIVVTRPRELAQGLAALIAQAGGEPLLFPAIEIRDAEDPAPARSLLARLHEFDLAVFVSPSAVRKALELAAGRAWPARLRVAAVGSGTRRELESRGFRNVIAPAAQSDSEALLALPEMAQLANARVLILRGAGGRELLGETLAARGARVEYAECYRRVRPEAGAGALAGRADAFCVGSGEALQNLVAMLGRERLAQAPLFVPHERVARLARDLGLREPVLAGPGDAEMLARMVAYFGGAK
jgi:uroporphyrinogen-III synthase